MLVLGNDCLDHEAVKFVQRTVRIARAYAGMKLYSSFPAPPGILPIWRLPDLHRLI